MSTSPGSTFAAMAETSLGPDEPEDPEEPDPLDPDEPEPADDGVVLGASDEESDDVLLVQATWPMAAPATRAAMAAASISVLTRRPRRPERSGAGSDGGAQLENPGLVGGAP